MKHIERCLFKSKCKEKYFLQIAYIVNVAVISVLVMIATGIDNVTNESLSANDLQQVENILSSVIFISVVTIIFFQWIVSMQFRALFDSRQQFNNNLRLLGASPKLLSRIYIKEMFFMQLISITVGIMNGEIIYYILSSVLGNVDRIIGFSQIIISILIHIIVILGCVILTYRKIAKKDIIETMRTRDELTSKYEVNKKKMIVGIVLLIIALISFMISGNEQTKPLLVTMVSIFILFDSVIYGGHLLLLKFAKKTNKSVLLFSEFISIGYLKKSKTVCKLIFFSVSLFLGLQMLYQNVRMCGIDVVESSIHYQGTMWQQDKYFADQIQDERLNGDVLYGLRYKVKNQGTVWYINGINSDFFKTWETINLCNNGGNNVNDIILDFDNENWNGILLPENYASNSDIGTNISIEIEGKELTFKIVGSYYSNNLAHWSFLVSKSYIQKELKRVDKSNIAYIKDINDLSIISNTHMGVQTYEDIREESYEQAVNGTALIEMMSLVIIVCALLALINFIMLSSKNDVIDIARFKGIGLRTKTIYSIYLSESLIPVIISVILAIPTSIIFAKCACLAVLDRYYYQHTYIISYNLMLIILIVISCVSMVAKAVSIIGSTNNKKYVSLLRDIKT